MTKMSKASDNRRPAKGGEFERFSLVFRIQHIGLFVGVIILIVTGLPLKYPEAALSEYFFRLIGGIAVSGIVHRVGASLLIAVGVFHMCYIAFTREGRLQFRHLFPRIKDVTDVFANLKYFFGFSKNGARFGRFSYLEKFDYWAVYWGMVIMIGTGLMLWFAGKVIALLPKFWIDVAREAHSDEALLATLAIIIWHFYNVHFNPEHFPMNTVWLNGKLSEDEMKRHHPLEHEELTGEEAEEEQ